MDYFNISIKFYYVILFLYVLLILLFNQLVFGVNLVFLAVYDQPNSKMFQLITLYVSSIFNYVAMMDNTTYFMNAIYSFLLYIALLLFGTRFFISLQKPSEGDVSPLIYLKMILVIIMDIFYYSYQNYNNQWFLFIVFVSFFLYDGPYTSPKIILYVIGLIINCFPFHVWNFVAYLLFIISISLIDRWIV
jgi:hypothetical protein